MTVEKVKLEVVVDDGEEMCERLVVSSCSVVVEKVEDVVGGGMYVVSNVVLEELLLLDCCLLVVVVVVRDCPLLEVELCSGLLDFGNSWSPRIVAARIMMIIPRTERTSLLRMSWDSFPLFF